MANFYWRLINSVAPSISVSGWTEYRDSDVTRLDTHAFVQWVISWFEVTTNLVSQWVWFINCLRTTTTPNENFFLLALSDNDHVIDTSWTKKIRLEVPIDHINDATQNTNPAGLGNVELKEGASYPTENYIPLASIVGGVITDERVTVTLTDIALDLANRQIIIDIEAELISLQNQIDWLSSWGSLGKYFFWEGVTIQDQVFLEWRRLYSDITELKSAPTGTVNWNLIQSIWVWTWYWTSFDCITDWIIWDVIWWPIYIFGWTVLVTLRLYNVTDSIEEFSYTTNVFNFLDRTSYFNKQIVAWKTYRIEQSTTTVTAWKEAYYTNNVWVLDNGNHFVNNFAGWWTIGYCIKNMEIDYNNPSIEKNLWDIWANERQTFKIVGWVDAFDQTRLALWKNQWGNPVDNVILRIETDSAWEPSGSLVHANATATIPWTWLTQVVLQDELVSLLWSITLVEWTVYHVVLSRSGALSGSDYYIVWYGSEETRSRTGLLYDGATWWNSFVDFPYFPVGTGSFTENNGLKKNLACLTDPNKTYQREHLWQMASPSAVLWEEKNVFVLGYVPQVGLTPWDTMRLSDSVPWGITSVVQVGDVKVGKAITEEVMRIQYPPL